jgi:hypothetical protein
VVGGRFFGPVGVVDFALAFVFAFPVSFLGAPIHVLILSAFEMDAAKFKSLAGFWPFFGRGAFVFGFVFVGRVREQALASFSASAFFVELANCSAYAVVLAMHYRIVKRLHVLERVYFSMC